MACKPRAELATSAKKSTFYVWTRHRLPETDLSGKIASYAKAKAEQDADFPIPWPPTKVRDFHDHLDRTPTNHRELADLAVMRFLDLQDDLENRDESVAKILQRVSEEPEIRNFLMHELRKASRGRYTITQEEEFADAKRPDLRFHGAGFDAPVPAELKLAERWTGPQLFERFENQLSGDYLRDNRSARGIFVLVNRATNKHCENCSGERLDFEALIVALREHWRAIENRYPHVEDITVIAIDLTTRSAASTSGSVRGTSAKQKTYDPRHSVNVFDHPPRERGIYAVLHADGTTSEAEWTSNQWLGGDAIARYSGRSVVLSNERRQEHIDDILGDLGLPKGVPEKQREKAAALHMAHHFGVKLRGKEQNLSECISICATAVTFYSVAKAPSGRV
jgi:hypothetical protein